MDVLTTLRLNAGKFLAVLAVAIAALNVVAGMREPRTPLYKTEALVVASELGIRVDAFPRTAVAIFNGGTVARLAASYAGTGISPDDLIPAIVDIAPVENTSVVEIDAIHPDPELAALYANAAGRALAEELNRVGPGLGTFALQIEANVPVDPLEVSLLPTVAFSVVAGLLLVGGIAALVAAIQSTGRTVPLFAGRVSGPETTDTNDEDEPDDPVIGTVRYREPPVPALNGPTHDTDTPPRVEASKSARASQAAIERSVAAPPPPRQEPTLSGAMSTREDLNELEPLIPSLEKINQPSPTHPLLFIDEEAAHVLESVEGVDSVFAARLVAAGITSLAELQGADGKWLSDAIEVRRDIVVDWISQAGRLIAIDEDDEASRASQEGSQFEANTSDTDGPGPTEEPSTFSTDRADRPSSVRGGPPIGPATPANGYKKPPPTSQAVAEDGEDLTLRSIRGIGAVFAERLLSVGIASVEDLANANASSLAYTMEVRYGTVADWIKQARSLNAPDDLASESR